MRQILRKSRFHFFAAGNFRKFFACLALGCMGFLGSCDSSTGNSDASAGTNGAGITSLYGTWMRVDSSFVRTSAGDIQSIDRDTMFFILAADGKFAEIKHAWVLSVVYGTAQCEFDTSVGTWGAAEGKLTSATVSSTDSADVGTSGTVNYSVSGTKLTLSGVNDGVAYSLAYVLYSSQTTIPTISGKGGSGSLVTPAAPNVTTPLCVSGYAANDTAVSLSANTTYHLSGSVENVASWTWTIVRASDNAVVDTLSATAPNGSSSTDIGTSTSSKLIQFTPTAKWGATGVYYVQGVLVGTDGSKLTAQVRIKAALAGTNRTALNLISSFQVGGRLTSAPSSISLGDGRAYKTSQLNASDRSNIDLYVSSNIAGYAVFESTEEALNNEDISDAAWGDGNATLIAKVTSAPTTLEEAKAVALGTSQSALIANGGVYVAKSVEGVYYVLKVSDVSGADDATTLTVTILK